MITERKTKISAEMESAFRQGCARDIIPAVTNSPRGNFGGVETLIQGNGKGTIELGDAPPCAQAPYFRTLRPRGHAISPLAWTRRHYEWCPPLQKTDKGLPRGHLPIGPFDEH